MPVMHVPREVIPHIKDAMRRKKAKTMADGFRHMAQYAMIGKEIENISTLSFPKVTLKPLFKKKRAAPVFRRKPKGGWR